MNSDDTQTKRLIRVTEGNIRQSHLYLNGHADLFPPECFGASSESAGRGRPVELQIAGFDEVVQTDIPRTTLSAKPRGFFRRRGWVRRFFQQHSIQPGDLIAIEKLSAYRYSIRPERPGSNSTAAEFFSGIGLVRLALERQGWNVLFANDIDPGKAEMYGDNWSKKLLLF